MNVSPRLLLVALASVAFGLQSPAAEEVERKLDASTPLKSAVASNEPKVKDATLLLFEAAFDVSPYRDYTSLSKIGILRVVQARLAYEGWYSGPLHGEFDESTQLAIRHWQKEKGMAGTGLLDESTLGSLNLLNLPETRNKMPVRSVPAGKR